MKAFMAQTMKSTTDVGFQLNWNIKNEFAFITKQSMPPEFDYTLWPIVAKWKVKAMKVVNPS